MICFCIGAISSDKVPVHFTVIVPSQHSVFVDLAIRMSIIRHYDPTLLLAVKNSRTIRLYTIQLPPPICYNPNAFRDSTHSICCVLRDPPIVVGNASFFKPYLV
jgi:hypothetical protein